MAMLQSSGGAEYGRAAATITGMIVLSYGG